MSVREAYARHDAFTDPGAFAALYDDLPKTPAALREVVSHLIVHVAWVAEYGISPDAPMSRDTLPARERLRLSQALAPGSLCASRPPAQRSFGTCRDYALMLCSMLRHHAIPARIRCGFATYFPNCAFEDHWICEFWSSQDDRWIRADAQLDQLLREQLGIRFDAANLPSTVFLTAAQAWRLTRSGGADSDAFGQGAVRGLWFIRLDVTRDLLALSNQPVSAWDTWRTARAEDKIVDEASVAAMDSIAELIADFEAGRVSIDRLKDAASQNQRPPWQN